jgi:hypothetical protein
VNWPRQLLLGNAGWTKPEQVHDVAGSLAVVSRQPVSLPADGSGCHCLCRRQASETRHQWTRMNAADDPRVATSKQVAPRIRLTFFMASAFSGEIE